MRGARATAHYAAYPPAINSTCLVALRQFEESSEALWDVLYGGDADLIIARFAYNSSIASTDTGRNELQQ